jgi:acyl-CoA thioesterase-1
MSSRSSSARSRKRSKKRRSNSTHPKWGNYTAVLALGVAAVALAGIALTQTVGPSSREIAAAETASQEASEAAAAQAAADAETARIASTAQVTRPSEGPLRVLFAGDSLTYGLYASTQENGFRSLMVDAFEQGGPVEEFRGERSGAGAGDVASILDVPDNVQLAVIELGTNDVGGETPIAEFTETYAALLDKVMAKSPDSALLCVGTWGSAGGGYGSDPYNDAIEAECKIRDGVFVSMYNLFPAAANRGPAGVEAFGGVSDDFHPNDTGYRAIADLLLGNITIS